MVTVSVRQIPSRLAFALGQKVDSNIIEMEQQVVYCDVSYHVVPKMSRPLFSAYLYCAEMRCRLSLLGLGPPPLDLNQGAAVFSSGFTKQ